MKLKKLLIEEWKEIEDFPGYLISNMGRVASPLGKEIRIYASRDKFKESMVDLFRNQKKYKRSVAKLVYTHFSDKKMKYKNGYVVHIDGDKFNNRIDNLKTALVEGDEASPEQLEAFEKWCYPSIKKCITQWNANRKGIDVENFMQEAALLLWKYLPSYDPKHYKFLTWGKKYINWAFLIELKKTPKTISFEEQIWLK